MSKEILDQEKVTLKKFATEWGYFLAGSAIALAALPIDMAKVLSGTAWDFLKSVKNDSVPYKDPFTDTVTYVNRKEWAVLTASDGITCYYALGTLPVKVLLGTPYIIAKDILSKRQVKEGQPQNHTEDFPYRRH